MDGILAVEKDLVVQASGLHRASDLSVPDLKLETRILPKVRADPVTVPWQPSRVLRKSPSHREQAVRGGLAPGILREADGKELQDGTGKTWAVDVDALGEELER